MSNYRQMHLIPPTLYAKLMNTEYGTTDGKCLNISQLNSIQNEDGGKVFISQKPEIQTSHNHVPMMSNSIKNEPLNEPSNLNPVKDLKNSETNTSHNSSFNLNPSKKPKHDMEASIASNTSVVNNAGDTSDLHDNVTEEPKTDNRKPAFVLSSKKLNKDISQPLITDYFSSKLPDNEKFTQVFPPPPPGVNEIGKVGNQTEQLNETGKHSQVGNQTEQVNVSGSDKMSLRLDDSLDKSTAAIDVPGQNGDMQQVSMNMNRSFGNLNDTVDNDIMSAAIVPLPEGDDVFEPDRASTPVENIDIDLPPSPTFMLSKSKKAKVKPKSKHEPKPVKRLQKTKPFSLGNGKSKSKNGRSKEEVIAPRMESEEKKIRKDVNVPVKKGQMEKKQSPAKKLKMARESIKDKYIKVKSKRKNPVLLSDSESEPEQALEVTVVNKVPPIVDINRFKPKVVNIPKKGEKRRAQPEVPPAVPPKQPLKEKGIKRVMNIDSRPPEKIKQQKSYFGTPMYFKFTK